MDDHNRIVSTGYNGSPAGTVHCISAGHLLSEINGRPSCVRSLHAESNALDYAGREARGCTMFVTVTPCTECAKRIVNAGIKRLVYHEHYDSRGAGESTYAFLRGAGIVLHQLNNERIQQWADLCASIDNVDAQEG